MVQEIIIIMEIVHRLYVFQKSLSAQIFGHRNPMVYQNTVFFPNITEKMILFRMQTKWINNNNNNNNLLRFA